MQMNIHISNGSCKVRLSGNFTFADNSAFKEVISMAESPDVQSFLLDFSNVDFVDSAVLGMLMILRNAAGNHGQSITILGAKGQVDKVMRISQFDTKFTMAP